MQIHLKIIFIISVDCAEWWIEIIWCKVQISNCEEFDFNLMLKSGEQVSVVNLSILW